MKQVQEKMNIIEQYQKAKEKENTNNSDTLISNVQEQIRYFMYSIDNKIDNTIKEDKSVAIPRNQYHDNKTEDNKSTNKKVQKILITSIVIDVYDNSFNEQYVLDYLHGLKKINKKFTTIKSIRNAKLE